MLLLMKPLTDVVSSSIILDESRNLIQSVLAKQSCSLYKERMHESERVSKTKQEKAREKIYIVDGPAGSLRHLTLYVQPESEQCDGVNEERQHHTDIQAHLM